MSEASDIKQTIIDSAADGIRTSIVDGDRVDSMPISEQISGANYIAAQNAKSNPTCGVIFRQFVPPGSL